MNRCESVGLQRLSRESLPNVNIGMQRQLLACLCTQSYLVVQDVSNEHSLVAEGELVHKIQLIL